MPPENTCIHVNGSKERWSSEIKSVVLCDNIIDHLRTEVLTSNKNFCKLSTNKHTNKPVKNLSRDLTNFQLLKRSSRSNVTYIKPWILCENLLIGVTELSIMPCKSMSEAEKCKKRGIERKEDKPLWIPYQKQLCISGTGLVWSRAGRWEPQYHLPPVLVMSHRTFDIDKTLFVSALSLLSQREQTVLLWLYPSCLFQSTVVQTLAECYWLQAQQALACWGKKQA